MKKVQSKEEYWNELRELNKKTFWATSDLMQVLQVSKQRVHQIADIYGWEPIHEIPKIWTKDVIIRDLAEILEKRKEAASKVLENSDLKIFAKFNKKDIEKTVEVFEDTVVRN